MIEVRDVTVSFGGVTVLENINLTIPENETTIIMGQSGCGKSVLMKTIEGLYRPDSGRVFIDGEDIFSMNRKQLKNTRRKLAMLFQGAALLDSLNVYQNVSLPLFEHTDKSEQEIYDIVTKNLELVGLYNVLNKMPSELSGGMKKRVALARAIVLQPEYIIYDEPTTGLDPIISAEIVSLIRKLKEHYKLTSIIITHDLDCINRIGGRIAMIHEKKIVFDGSYQDFQNAEDAYIKRFLNRNK